MAAGVTSANGVRPHRDRIVAQFEFPTFFRWGPRRLTASGFPRFDLLRPEPDIPGPLGQFRGHRGCPEGAETHVGPAEAAERRAKGHRIPVAKGAAFETLDGIADDILTLGMSEARPAGAPLRTTDGISARDALHVAVIQEAGSNRILSFDSGSDACPGINRLG